MAPPGNGKGSPVSAARHRQAENQRKAEEAAAAAEAAEAAVAAAAGEEKCKEVDKKKRRSTGKSAAAKRKPRQDEVGPAVKKPKVTTHSTGQDLQALFGLSSFEGDPDDQMDRRDKLQYGTNNSDTDKSKRDQDDDDDDSEMEDPIDPEVNPDPETQQYMHNNTKQKTLQQLNPGDDVGMGKEIEESSGKATAIEVKRGPQVAVTDKGDKTFRLRWYPEFGALPLVDYDTVR